MTVKSCNFEQSNSFVNIELVYLFIWLFVCFYTFSVYDNMKKCIYGIQNVFDMVLVQVKLDFSVIFIYN